MIFLFVIVQPSQWSLAFGKLPYLVVDGDHRHRAILVRAYRDEDSAKSAMGALGLLLMQKAAECPMFDVRDIAVMAIDEFMRMSAA